VARCQNCGQDNPERARYCSECATPLPPVTAAVVAEERKVVTVLFCDLVGFTAASDHADPEDVRARIRPYHLRLRTEIERYGGTVEKFIGDAVMAVFGAPTAHEDDPERAVRAALQILEAIEELNEADSSLGLQVRVGIETGETVVALGARPELGEGMVTGDVVNIASRLQGAASVNGIAVGEGTYSATKEVFDYEDLEPVTVKGKAQPISIWRARAARARFGTDLTRRLTTPLVGRELEVGLLTGTFERAVRDRSFHMVTVVGEPGVGKSRLVAELSAFVDSWPGLVRWRQGRCLPYGDGITFWALGEIVKAEAGIFETDPPQTAASKIDAIVRDDHLDAPWLRQRLRPLVGLEAPQADREENFAAWRAFLEILAEDRPSIFVFEDLHWADEALLGFLEHLAGYAEGVPMLLVGTARPELLERSPGFAQTARNSNRVNLAPLTERETAQLISNLMGRAVMPAEIQQAILGRSGGNPLYAEEFARLLRDRGILRKHGATWSIDREAEIPLPSGVQGLIAARLDTLSLERKRLLQDASVVGKVFWSGAVADMARMDAKQVQEDLHELSRKELVRPARVSSMEGQSEYAFLHALVRDVCYAQILRGSRAELHMRAASWIEASSGERVEDHAEILAAHYLTALELSASATNSVMEELRAKALRYLTLAGDRAMGIDAEAAERHYARAIGMTTTGDVRRPEILSRHAEALGQRGRFPEAARAYEDAIVGLKARDDAKAAAVAMSRCAYLFTRLGDPRGRTISAEALALIDPLGPSPQLAKVLGEHAGSSFIWGEFREAIALADRAISVAETLGLPEPAKALGMKGASRAFLGDAEGLVDMRRAMEAASAQGLGREIGILHNNLAEALWPIEGPGAALKQYQEGADFAKRRGMEELVLLLTGGVLDAFADLGFYPQAAALASELLTRLEAAEDEYTLAGVRSAQLRLRVRRGEHREATSLADLAVKSTRELGAAQFVAYAFPVAAALRLAQGDPSGATALLSELEETANVRDESLYSRGLVEAVGTALGAGNLELAARLAEGVVPRHPLQEHALVTARALLAEHRGELAEAEPLFAEAADRWEQFEMPWERGQALLGQGRCLLALGRTPEGLMALREARRIFAALGARPALMEADDELRGGTARTS
jgi:class 3 adenylate cyclase/tetratricopeptide (TPR) repeat protein